MGYKQMTKRSGFESLFCLESVINHEHREPRVLRSWNQSISKKLGKPRNHENLFRPNLIIKPWNAPGDWGYRNQSVTLGTAEPTKLIEIRNHEKYFRPHKTLTLTWRSEPWRLPGFRRRLAEKVHLICWIDKAYFATEPATISYAIHPFFQRKQARLELYQFTLSTSTLEQHSRLNGLN